MTGWMKWAVPALWLVTTLAHAQASTNDSDLEARLSREARLEWVVQAALARSVVLEEASARARAVSERASGAGRLPDAELKYEQWGVPLNRPYALQRADTLMLGLRQAFPAPGSRQESERAASEEAGMARDQRRTTERELLRRVRSAYFEYYAADRVLAVHREHVGITEQMLAQTRANYENGRGTQQDILKAVVELSRLHNDLVDIRQQRETSRFLLNTLMGRATDAPLGPPSDELPAAATNLDPSRLERRMAETRPELAAAARAIKRSQAQLAAARHSARRPSFMVGADYWLMPTLDSPHAYGAMVAMSLPWLNPGRAADVRAAEETLHADRSAAENMLRLTSFELYEAIAKLEAATTSLDIIERDLLAQATQSLEAAQSSFAVGQSDLLSLLDAQRSYFQVRVEHTRAMTRVRTQLAELEFASGARLFQPPVAESAQ
jgi:outer membrane protein TolC